MKNNIFPFLSAFLILLVACNRIDNAFVEQIQAGLTKAQDNKTAFQSSQEQCTALIEKMKNAPDGLKNNPKFGYVDLLSRAAQIQQSCASMIVSQDEMVAKAQTLLDEYTDGKAKKDSINAEISTILSNFDGYQSRIGRMNTIIEEAEKGFDQAMAAWNAAPEAEKIASAAMPAPVMPDWVTGSTAVPQAAPGALMAPGAAGQNAAGGTPQAVPGAAAPGAAAPGTLVPAGTTPPPTTGGPGALSAPKQDGKKQ